MTTITLEAIKAEQSRIAEMIASFEKQPKPLFAWEGTIEVTCPKLNPGEKFVGVIMSADGTKREHIILLPGEIDDTNWNDATKWAESIGGELPDRTEGALLFATMKDEFKPEAYWTRELCEPDSGSAWFQGFHYGGQRSGDRGYGLRARAVRRVAI